MKSDIEIARETVLKPITEVANTVGIAADKLEHYGKYIAKVPLECIDESKVDRCNMILMTAMSPTKAGIGKTTVSVGLSMALNRLGYKCGLALREPSMGPCFGMKGGAAGGGYSQVLPMDKINLHFTGDFHAITAAHNLIAALLDNYIFRHQGEPCELKTVYWGRVLDVNDRALRKIVIGLGAGNGVVRESGFDISVASEIMAILCLAKDLEDLRRRLENILLGITCEGKPFYLRDLGSVGSILVILKDALQPNLVQTTENTPAFIHGGPFANIAHGCNSVVATRAAMKLGEYAITEAGFGSDLGAEKFYNIKCRAAGLNPAAVVLVTSTKALKWHGGVPLPEIGKPNAEALKKGLCNLDAHVENLKRFGPNIVVSINHFHTDLDEEIAIIRNRCAELGVRCAISDGFALGGKGALEVAQAVIDAAEDVHPLNFTYEVDAPVLEKVEKIAKTIYGAASVELAPAALKDLKRLQDLGFDRLPVCIAKTPFSFSHDPKLLGAPKGFTLPVQRLILNAGAGFIVVTTGAIMRMPGLPKVPAAMSIDVKDGKITGLA